jgi:hypothetical protein
LRDGFIFYRSALGTIVGCEFWKAGKYELQRKTAIGLRDDEAIIWTKRLDIWSPPGVDFALAGFPFFSVAASGFSLISASIERRGPNSGCRSR